MKALICDRLAPDLAGVRLGDCAIPTVGSHDVLVRNRSTCVNFPDLLMTEGKYQHRPALPFVLGMESAGDVIEVGPQVSGIKPGDRVIVSGKSGAFAEYRVANAHDTRPIPDGLNYAQAAAHTVGLLTAYVALKRLGKLEQGETILIHGAAGGVGSAAVALAQHFGGSVIATASSEEKRQWLRDEHKVSNVFEPSEKLREQLMSNHAFSGVDICFDPVGGYLFDQSVRCMAFGGRYLVVGFSCGDIPVISVNYPLIKGFSIIGVRAGEYGRQFPDLGAENIKAIDALAEQGLRPHIGARFDLSDAAEALLCLQARTAIGKIAIMIS